MTIGSVGGRCQTASEKPLHPQHHAYQYRHHGVRRQRRTSHGPSNLQSHQQSIKRPPKRVGAFIALEDGMWQRNPNTQHAPQTTTTSRGTKRDWSGSHHPPHPVNGVLVVGSSNRGRDGEKGDQNLGQRNPEARGSSRPNYRST